MGRGDVGEPEGPADVLHLLELLDSSVEDAAGRPRKPQIGFPRAPLALRPNWALKTNVRRPVPPNKGRRAGPPFSPPGAAILCVRGREEGLRKSGHSFRSQF